MIFSSLLLAAVPALPTVLLPQEDGPPGLMYLKGGRTTIGSDKKDLLKIFEDTPGVQGLSRAFDAETPQHSQTLAPYYLMTTECTNEQYAAFVIATGSKPPYSWGKVAVQTANLAHAESEQLKWLAAKEEGERYEKKIFDREAWWNVNWQETDWEMPMGEERHPVGYVDYGMSSAYCQWAGIRLMTEFEFQHAVRKNGKENYTWKGEFEVGKYAATNEIKQTSDAFEVGSFAAGASKDGIYDLCGNVWEWTSSPYMPYERFKPNTYKIKGKDKIVLKPAPAWDANQRITVGGSIQNSKLVARCTTRRPADRVQSTDALGFRAAASGAVGVDMAATINSTDIAFTNVALGESNYDTTLTIALDRWESEPGSGGPEGYSIITGYDYVIFTPIAEIAWTSIVDIRKNSLISPIPVGFLATNQAIVEPALPPGTYIVAFRGKGDTKVIEEEEPEDEDKKNANRMASPQDEDEEEEGGSLYDDLIDTKRENLLFIDANTAELVASVKAEKVSIGKTKKDGHSMTLFEKTIWVKDEDGDQVQDKEPWLRIAADVRSKLNNHTFKVNMELKVEKDMAAKNWQQSKTKK
jgi:formylglycine-generating enzyme required for sulfatase activity